MRKLERAHWPLWHTYADALEDAQSLAQILLIPIVFKRWGNGWVIWNYRNLDFDRWKRHAEDHANEEREQERRNHYSPHDNYSDEWYTTQDLAQEAEEYATYVVGYE